MPRFPSRIARAAAAVALFVIFAPPARAEELEVTYTSSHVGAEIFEFNTLDGSYDGLGADGQGEIVFPLSYDSQGNDSVTFAAPGVESNYPGTIIITCCATGFFDGVDPPNFTGGTTILTWTPGIYAGSYGTFAVALAPSAPEISTWVMMLVGFGGLSFAVRRRRAGELRNSDSARPQAAR